LANASRERAVAQERAEQSARAHKKVVAELRAAEKVLASKIRIVSIWATRVMAAEDVADECRHYLEAKDAFETARTSLLGLAQTRFPNVGLLENDMLAEALRAQTVAPTPQE